MHRPRPMPRLIIVSTAPVIETGPRHVFLDKKFIEGMHLHVRHWPGPVSCILRRGDAGIPFGAEFRRDGLDFELILIGARQPLSPGMVAAHDVVLLSGDSHLELLPPRLRRAIPGKVAYAVEYTLRTRLQTAALDRSGAPLRRLHAQGWLRAQEWRRRRAFRAADALQANGYPAEAAYRPMTGNMLLYLDNRMTPGLFATPGEMARRREHLAGGGPIRLIHSGRLEPMKGAQDLVPVARALAAAGLDFTLDIYGAGSLRAAIAEGIGRHGLGSRVRLHDPVDFETVLVPLSRRGADIFLSCHRQSDPSCTYLESLGCGLALAGYDNEMWSALLARSGAGWAVPMGDTAALARQILALAADRAAIVQRAERGLAFARAHDFETEFARRMEHLRGLIGP